MTVKSDMRPLSGDYTGQISRSTYVDAWKMRSNLPSSPFKPLDCYLVCKKLEEKTAIKGFVIAGSPEYEKEREIDVLVIAAGPGYHIMHGTYPKQEVGQFVPNEVKPGDVVRILERAAAKVEVSDELYYFIESHKIYFIVDPDEEFLQTGK